MADRLADAPVAGAAKATLVAATGYKPGTRVPAVLYAYPLDYADPSQAGQVTAALV